MKDDLIVGGIIITGYDSRNCYNLVQVIPKGKWHVYIDNAFKPVCNVETGMSVTYMEANQYKKRQRRVCLECFKQARLLQQKL